jgi:ornithine cyclodeaminase
VKAATGFWGNPDLGLPLTNGLFLVFSAQTGILAAILFDNGYLTELRTGAAGALAAELLAPATIEQAAIVGAGGQARYQLEALLGVRRPQRIVVASRSGADRYAAEMRELHGVEVDVAADIETAVRGSQLVVTTTPSREPVVRADWVQPGTHITAMGSDFSEKQELETAVLALADGSIALENVVALGAIVNGAPGRTSASQITVADLCGVGVQDAAVAADVMRRAAAADAGRRLEL